MSVQQQACVFFIVQFPAGEYGCQSLLCSSFPCTALLSLSFILCIQHYFKWPLVTKMLSLQLCGNEKFHTSHLLSLLSKSASQRCSTKSLSISLGAYTVENMSSHTRYNGHILSKQSQLLWISHILSFTSTSIEMRIDAINIKGEVHTSVPLVISIHAEKFYFI